MRAEFTKNRIYKKCITKGTCTTFSLYPVIGNSQKNTQNKPKGETGSKILIFSIIVKADTPKVAGTPRERV